MPSIRKQKAPPQAGQQEESLHEMSMQIPTAAPERTVRRSQRIRAQGLVKIRQSSIRKPNGAVSPSRKTRKTKTTRRGRPRKSHPGKLDGSPTREVGTVRGRGYATAPSLPEKNQATTGRTRETARQKSKGTGTQRVEQGAPDTDSQKPRQYSRLDLWLEEVRASSAAYVDPSDPRSTSYSTESSVVSEQQSTGKSDEEIRELAEGLRTRRIEFERRAKDLKTPKLKFIIVSEARTIGLEQTELLRDKMKLFLRKTDEVRGSASLYDTLEELSDAINEWKSKAHMASITNREFIKDLEHCKYPPNEAMFQRTVPMSILNRHQISDKFDFNCEGQWSLQSNYYPLPSTEENNIVEPKPDLAVFFRFNSLVGPGPYLPSIPIPERLKPCISPDGYTNRCFPFLFIEAKKGFHDLTPALMANMHHASQALFNIYVFMTSAGHRNRFFFDVRVFSIAINAEKFALRVHWVNIAPGWSSEELVFRYDDICSGPMHERDGICNLIRNILVGYAETTLFDVLKQSLLEY
ncbi:hypothetical protein GGR55DRAFT_198297 [Xylaria sp. FL0064]|nr:hypothetical protein GGR55DRAFT_198297 [Xylaria sp. FL0064]